MQNNEAIGTSPLKVIIVTATAHYDQLLYFQMGSLSNVNGVDTNFTTFHHYVRYCHKRYLCV